MTFLARYRSKPQEGNSSNNCGNKWQLPTFLIRANEEEEADVPVLINGPSPP